MAGPARAPSEYRTRGTDRDAARRRGVESDRPDSYNSHAAGFPKGSSEREALDPDRHVDNNPACWGVVLECEHRCGGCGKYLKAGSPDELKALIYEHQGRSE